MTFVPSRKVGAAFFGVFLIGAAVGALVVWMFQGVPLTRFLTLTSDPKSMAARINQKYLKEYRLGADEQARIAPLTEEMAQHLYQTRRQFGVDIIATLDDYHRKIGEQMTPDHRQAYDLANAERKKRMSAMLLLDSGPAPDAGAK